MIEVTDKAFQEIMERKLTILRKGLRGLLTDKLDVRWLDIDAKTRFYPRESIYTAVVNFSLEIPIEITAEDFEQYDREHPVPDVDFENVE
jgi:hypothetical protein